jgi:hypothetical protein
MNIIELEVMLKQIGANPLHYEVGGYCGSNLGLSLKLNPDKWDVYHSECGRHELLASFDSESEACVHFLEIIGNNRFYLTHNIGTFNNLLSAQTLAQKLEAAQINSEVREIGIGSVLERQINFQVLVFGSDFSKAKTIRGY